MSRFVVDHLFIMTSVDAPEAARLAALGLIEGSRNVHPGQGTANRRFFFQNFMLELLWVNDENADVISEPVRRTRLLARWRDHSACPFGICFLPEKAGTSAPFAGWPYRPEYARGTTIHVASEAALSEPMWFYFDSLTPRQMCAIREKEPTIHPLGVRELTSIRITVPTPPHSEPSVFAAREQLVDFGSGSKHVAELTFDDGASGRHVDLRPGLPLVIRW